ncbi:MAG TPA: EI24 domain-containing protein [Thauera sp.]|uniref:EI24 domain-containing protein n=1 Tax=Thauera sp. TaxID=1905334 RepID=UPI002B658BD0|nr:EI24 domain-containing protein [Thauera sp.]HRP25312.1 EI24 domain-containing protein [Thauera sp.]HRP65636.1 EI24 domain-containing protein [Thauera sp.]
MKDILVAVGRASRSLLRRDIFWHLLWPGLAAMVVWTVIAVMAWTPVTEGLFAWVAGWSFVGTWLSASEAAAAVMLVLIKIAVALLVVPLIYVTAALLVATIALPLMLERIGRTDYADIEQRRGGSNVGSAWNSIVAGGLFLLALLVSLPFWLIPGVGLLASVVLTGWLNQRAFGYDALMLHADRDELARLRNDWRPQMLLLGGGCSLLAYVPFVNLLAPAFAGLAFVHYMLETLRRHRLQHGVTVLDADGASSPRKLP